MCHTIDRVLRHLSVLRADVHICAVADDGAVGMSCNVVVLDSTVMCIRHEGE